MAEDSDDKNKQAVVDHVKVDDVEIEEVWERLKQDPGSVLIDVRTQAEWAPPTAAISNSFG